MSALPSRIALATLALLVGVLVFGDALVLSLRPGVSLMLLARPTLALFVLALAAAGFAYSHTRALVRELSAMGAELRSPVARMSHLPVARFQESHALRTELSLGLAALRAAEASLAAQRVKTDAPLALRIRFVAAMGHDLRTPLNAMLGFADLLAIDRSSTWNVQQKHSLAILRDRTRDLLGLIDDMIDWAKLESGELSMQLRACPTLSVIERALDTAKQRSGARGLRTSVEVEPGLPLLWVDEDRMVQALVGLMDNAARSEDRPELLVRASRTVSGARVPLSGPHLQIEVVDSQLEIREIDREHLFRAFRPSFAPSGRRIAGLSLGTAMARALIRAQGGDVWFEGRPERGTTFVLALPTATDPAHAKAAIP